MRSIVALLIVLVIVVGGVQFLSGRTTVQADTSTAPAISAEREIVVEHYFNQWVYIVSQEPDGFLNAGASYNGNEGLENYYLETQGLAPSLFEKHETADVYVYFRSPLLESELPESIQKTPEQVLRYSLLYIDQQGADVWFATERNTNDSALVNYQQLQNEYPDLTINPAETRREGNSRLAGFTQMDMRVTQAQYQALLESPDVAAVDIGPALALAEAGFGTHSSDRVSFHYPLFAPTDAEIKVLDNLK